MTDQNVNSKIFLSILDEFDENGKNYTLFGDNASWHTSKECLTEYFNRGNFFIKNVPYSP